MFYEIPRVLLTAHSIYVTVYWAVTNVIFCKCKVASVRPWGCREVRRYGSSHTYTRHCMEVSSWSCCGLFAAKKSDQGKNYKSFSCHSRLETKGNENV